MGKSASTPHQSSELQDELIEQKRFGLPPEEIKQRAEEFKKLPKAVQKLILEHEAQQAQANKALETLTKSRDAAQLSLENANRRLNAIPGQLDALQADYLNKVQVAEAKRDRAIANGTPTADAEKNLQDEIKLLDARKLNDTTQLDDAKKAQNVVKETAQGKLDTLEPKIKSLSTQITNSSNVASYSSVRQLRNDRDKSESNLHIENAKLELELKTHNATLSDIDTKEKERDAQIARDHEPLNKLEAELKADADANKMSNQAEFAQGKISQEELDKRNRKVDEGLGEFLAEIGEDRRKIEARRTAAKAAFEAERKEPQNKLSETNETLKKNADKLEEVKNARNKELDTLKEAHDNLEAERKKSQRYDLEKSSFNIRETWKKDGKKRAFLEALKQIQRQLPSFDATPVAFDPNTLELSKGEIQGRIFVPAFTFDVSAELAISTPPVPVFPALNARFSIGTAVSAQAGAKFEFEYRACDFGSQGCFDNFHLVGPAAQKYKNGGKSLDGFATVGIEAETVFSIFATAKVLILGLVEAVEARVSLDAVATIPIQFSTKPTETKLELKLKVQGNFGIQLFNFPVYQTVPFTFGQLAWAVDADPSTPVFSWKASEFAFSPSATNYIEDFKLEMQRNIQAAKNLLSGNSGAKLHAGLTAEHPSNDEFHGYMEPSAIAATAVDHSPARLATAIEVGPSQNQGQAVTASDDFDSRQTAMPLGIVQGTIRVESTSSGFDNDYFSFRLNDKGRKGDAVVLTARELQGTQLSLFGPAGQLLSTGKLIGGQLVIDLEFVPAGLYYLVISAAAPQPIHYALAVSGPSTDKPNLVADLAIPPSEVTLGRSLPLEFTITNTGFAPAPPTQARLLLSRDAIFEASDISLAQSEIMDVPALAPGQSFSRSLVIEMPTQNTGRMYMALFADWRDELKNESAESDNQMAFPIDIVLPLDREEPNDGLQNATALGSLGGGSLVFSRLNFDNSQDQDLFQFRLLDVGTSQDTIQVTARDGSAEIGLEVFNDDGVLVAEITPDAQGTRSSISVDLADLPAGPYVVVVYTVGDPEYYDLDFTSQSRDLHDLVVLSADTSPQIRPEVENIVSANVIHYGLTSLESAQAWVELEAPGEPVYAGPHLFLDTVASDTLIALSLPVTAPASFAGKDVIVRVRVDADSSVRETDLSNNSAVVRATILSVADPHELDEILTGKTNLGVLDGNQEVLGVALDTDFDNDSYAFRLSTAAGSADQILVTTADVNAKFEVILTGTQQTDIRANSESGQALIPLNGLDAGDYSLLIQHASDDTRRLDYQIQFDAPPNTLGPDLRVSGMLLDVAAVDAGSDLLVSTTILNQGTSSATAFQAQFVLSNDRVFSLADDVAIGNPFTLDAIEANQSFFEQRLVTIPANTPFGIKYLGLVLDVGNQSGDIAAANNTAGSPLSIAPLMDVNEPNDTVEQATIMAFSAGEFLQNNLTIGVNDNDLFQFTMPASGSKSDQIVITTSPEQGQLNAAVLDEFQSPVVVALAQNGQLTLSLTGLPAGKYYLVVSGDTILDLSAAYSVRLQLVAGGSRIIAAQPQPLPLDNVSHAAATPTPIPSTQLPFGTVDIHAPLSQVVTSYTALALNLWQESLGRMVSPQLQLQTLDLADGMLALAHNYGINTSGLPGSGMIQIDVDASGRGWFLDPTPLDHNEFAYDAQNRLIASPDRGAERNYDLFTVVLHEVGHVLGFTDAYPGFAQIAQVAANGKVSVKIADQLIPVTSDRDHLDPSALAGDLMSPSLSVGMRKLPSALDAAVLRAAYEAGSRGMNSGGSAAITSQGDNGPDIAPFGHSPDSPIVNGDFATSDPTDPAFGWTVRGNTIVLNNQLVLSDGAPQWAGLKQAIVLPHNARSVQFTISSLQLGHSAGLPPDAFEVALLHTIDATTLVAPIAGIDLTDALLNVQADGRVFYSPDVTLPGAGPSGNVASLNYPVIVSIALPPTNDDTSSTLFFDLLGFGAADSSVTIDDVTISLGSDVIPPQLSLPQDFIVEATSASGASVSFVAAATDNFDGTVPVNCTPASGTVFGLGSTTVQCSAIDSAGNPANGSFKVNVADRTAPTISVSRDLTLEATGPNGAAVVFTASAIDQVSGSLNVICSVNSGSILPLGVTNVSCSATDSAGNRATTAFKVTVTDTISPHIVVPQTGVSAEATGPTGARVVYEVSSQDAVDGTLVVACSPASGSTFAIGTTTVNCSVTDSNNNRATSQFSVTVADSSPPVLNLPTSVTVEAAGPAGAPVIFNASASDLVDGSTTTTCSANSGTILPVGSTTIQCTSTDSHGNRGVASFVANVRDTTPPVLSVPSDLIVEATSVAGAAIELIAPATDLVDGAITATCLPQSQTVFAIGTTHVVCTATDRAGNQASAGLNVIVRATGAISGFVYVDINNNGIKDPQEIALPNVPVTMTGGTPRTVVTDEHGAYHFDSLPPANYRISAIQPTAFTDGKDTLGTPPMGEAMDDEFRIGLAPGAKLLNYNFGERGLKPQFISKRLLLASTPSVLHTMVNLSGNAVAAFAITATANGIIDVQGGSGAEAEMPVFDVYTSDYVPVTLGTPGHLIAPIADGKNYVLVVSGASTNSLASAAVPVKIRLQSASWDPQSAGPMSTYTHPGNRYDVDGNGAVEPLDAILVINELNGSGTHSLVQAAQVSGPYIDVSGDNLLNPIDAVLVINYLNAQFAAANRTANAEGESLDPLKVQSAWNETMLTSTFVGPQLAAFDDQLPLLHSHAAPVDQLMQLLGSSRDLTVQQQKMLASLVGIDRDEVDGNVDQSITDWLEYDEMADVDLTADLLHELARLRAR